MRAQTPPSSAAGTSGRSYQHLRAGRMGWGARKGVQGEIATLVSDGDPHNLTPDHSDLVCELAQQRLEGSVSSF